MTLDDYNSFCASLPATSHVVQWGGAHVWKVGAKVFAIGGWDQGQQLFVTFNAPKSPMMCSRSSRACDQRPILPRAA